MCAVRAHMLVRLPVPVHATMCMEVRGRLARVRSFLLLFGFWGMYPGHQTQWQTPLPAKPSCQPCIYIFPYNPWYEIKGIVPFTSGELVKFIVFYLCSAKDQN